MSQYCLFNDCNENVGLRRKLHPTYKKVQFLAVRSITLNKLIQGLKEYRKMRIVTVILRIKSTYR